MRNLVIFALVFCTTAFAQTVNAINGQCAKGGQSVLYFNNPSTGTQPIGGGTKSSNTGAIGSYPSCKIQVLLTGTISNATLYKDSNLTPLVNPFTANTDGSFLFFVQVGQGYDVIMSGGGLPSPVSLTDVWPGTPLGSGSGGFPASPFCSVQFNNAGAFGGDFNFCWNDASLYLLFGNAATTIWSPSSPALPGTVTQSGLCASFSGSYQPALQIANLTNSPGNTYLDDLVCEDNILADKGPALVVGNTAAIPQGFLLRAAPGPSGGTFEFDPVPRTVGIGGGIFIDNRDASPQLLIESSVGERILQVAMNTQCAGSALDADTMCLGGATSTGGAKLQIKGIALITSNCSNSSSPATCGSSYFGSVALAAGATTLVVDTTAVTANSFIFLQRDNSLGTRLGITCNTQSSLTLGTPYVSDRSAGVSFTVTLDVTPSTNPLCMSYEVTN